MTRRILVIDDEVAIHIIVKASLEIIAGWQVSAAASATEGINLAQAEQPDAILLDVMMPDVDGLAVFQKLQDSAVTRNIPVILLTAKVRETDRQDFEALDVAGIITKPFEPDAISTQIQALLQWLD